MRRVHLTRWKGASAYGRSLIFKQFFINQEWNNSLNKIEAFYAGKMTERRNGTVVTDLTGSKRKPARCMW